MITAAQMRAARALLGIDQQTLAGLADVSLPTIQRMEASQGNVRGVVDTLTKVVQAFDAAGVELIGENNPSQGKGRGVRLKEAAVLKKPSVQARSLAAGPRPPQTEYNATVTADDAADDPAAPLQKETDNDGRDSSQAFGKACGADIFRAVHAEAGYDPA
jgi:transcriptional regulator with XRE-family HTH domain